MSVFYDNKKIIPAPLVNIARKTERSADGIARSKTFTITVTGTLSAHKGSPDYQGSFWTLSGYPPDTPTINLTTEARLAIFREKIGALTQLFEDEGKWFEIQPYDNTAPIKFKPRFNGIDYETGSWHDRVDYTISLETDCIYFGDTEICSSTRDDMMPEESWTIEQADEFGRTYRLTHTVTAQAKRRFQPDGDVEAEGWEIARELVLGGSLVGGGTTLLGFDPNRLQAAGVLNLTGFEPFNHARVENIDEAQGRYSVTETWLCIDPADGFGDSSAGKVIEDMQVDIKTSAESGLTTVSLNGTITGMLERDGDFEITTSRWTNAFARWADIVANPAYLLARAETHAGRALHPTPLVNNNSRNTKTGIITYNVEYDSRAAFTNGSYLSELISISIRNPCDVFARIGVIGRNPYGPILQAIGSQTDKSVTVSADIVVNPSQYGDPAPSMPTFDPLPHALEVIVSYTKLFKEQDTINWTKQRGRYSRNTTYVWE